MTKPQTFDEWLISYCKDIETLDMVIASRIAPIRDAYAAGMENAARICEEGMDRNPKGEPYDCAFNAHAFGLAEAIREATKRCAG